MYERQRIVLKEGNVSFFLNKPTIDFPCYRDSECAWPLWQEEEGEIRNVRRGDQAGRARREKKWIGRDVWTERNGSPPSLVFRVGSSGGRERIRRGALGCGRRRRAPFSR